MSDQRFIKIVSDILLNARDLAQWGVDMQQLTEDDLRMIVIKRDPRIRREAALKLVENGASIRQTAKLLGVSHMTVSRDVTKSVTECDTDDAEYDTAYNEIEADIRKKNAQLKLVPSETTSKQYGTIVIDPPWEMEKIKREVRPKQVAFDYPTMTEDQLAEYPVEPMARADCHLFCWTTQKHLPLALKLMPVWGFKYTLLMTWHKSGGFQPVGLPQYNSEFVVYARRGDPKFAETIAFCTCFQGERREHSRKPDEFYNMIRRVTADGRIDVFSREKRDGFDQLGNEKDKFASAVSA